MLGFTSTTDLTIAGMADGASQAPYPSFSRARGGGVCAPGRGACSNSMSRLRLGHRGGALTSPCLRRMREDVAGGGIGAPQGVSYPVVVPNLNALAPSRA